MNRTIGTIREFNTDRFRVVVRALEEIEPLDLSWDEDGSTAEGLESGEYIAFCAHAFVVYKPTGAVLADDYLGQCIYENLAAFMDHKECGRQNEEYRAAGKDARCGSYFVDMVHNVCRDARTALEAMQGVKIRKRGRA